MFHVVVIDTAAGWAVEKHGPYVQRTDAESMRRRLRAQFARTEAFPSITPARSANDSYDVRIVESSGDGMAA